MLIPAFIVFAALTTSLFYFGKYAMGALNAFIAHCLSFRSLSSISLLALLSSVAVASQVPATHQHQHTQIASAQTFTTQRSKAQNYSIQDSSIQNHTNQTVNSRPLNTKQSNDYQTIRWQDLLPDQQTSTKTVKVRSTRLLSAANRIPIKSSLPTAPSASLPTLPNLGTFDTTQPWSPIKPIEVTTDYDQQNVQILGYPLAYALPKQTLDLAIADKKYFLLVPNQRMGLSLEPSAPNQTILVLFDPNKKTPWLKGNNLGLAPELEISGLLTSRTQTTSAESSPNSLSLFGYVLHASNIRSQ